MVTRSRFIGAVRRLSLLDWTATFVLSPMIGWFLVMGGPTFSDGGAWTRVAMRQRLPGWLNCSTFLLFLVGAALVGLLSPRFGGFANVLIMSPVLVFVIDDFWYYPDYHGVVGVEVLMYAAFTGIAVCGGFGAVLVRLLIRRRVKS